MPDIFDIQLEGNAIRILRPVGHVGLKLQDAVEPLHTASGFKAIDMFQDVLVIVACCCSGDSGKCR